MLYVSLHVFRNILSAQCRIRFEDNSENTDTLSINLKSMFLNISLMRNDVLQNTFDFLAPAEFFIPTSISGVSSGTSFSAPNSNAHFLNSIPTISKNGKKIFESSFRFQITNTEVLHLIESNIDGNVGEIHTLSKRFMDNLHNPLSEKQISQIDVKEALMLRFKPKTYYQIHCTECDVALGEAIFEDIKEYCSESFSEGWFCHQSDNLRINDRLSSECMYIDETSFLFPDVHLIQNLCSCQSSLCVEGSQPSGFVRVYFDKVIFKNPELPLSVNGRDYKKLISLLTLWSLIEKSRTLSLFTKMLIQSKPNSNEEDACLLLMIPKEKVSRFQLQQPISQIPTSTNLWTESVYHVLYQVGTHASRDVKSWRHAFDVDFYRVSDTMMDVVTGVLRDSCVEEEPLETGFSYGYLPACSLEK